MNILPSFENFYWCYHSGAEKPPIGGHDVFYAAYAGKCVFLVYRSFWPVSVLNTKTSESEIFETTTPTPILG